MAAERNVCPEGGCPAADGGQGSSALSVPMREDSPAARITPAKLGARDIKSFDCRFPSEDWKPGESDWQSQTWDSNQAFPSLSSNSSAAVSGSRPDFASTFTPLPLNQLICGTAAVAWRRM